MLRYSTPSESQIHSPGPHTGSFTVNTEPEAERGGVRKKSTSHESILSLTEKGSHGQGLERTNTKLNV